PQPPSQSIDPIALASDGLLTIDKARSCCEHIWADWRAAGLDDPVLIAIGGGSVMDLAKLVRWFPTGEQAMALAALDDEAWFEAMLQRHEDFRRCALLLMPSTSGTGSEVTAYATVWGSLAQREKLSFTGPACFADVALIDYELSLSCSYTLTRDCGLDALSHALDALWNRGANKTDRDQAIRIASNIVDEVNHRYRNHDDDQHGTSLRILKASNHLIDHHTDATGANHTDDRSRSDVGFEAIKRKGNPKW
ncbi:MAG: iron-containing alcohol dehydrogenase, partial [Betaproteobacteria bacterium]|nr:iron-containing alcohol dehydrogenase [Betaproteobacteria bacterium]